MTYIFLGLLAVCAIACGYQSFCLWQVRREEFDEETGEESAPAEACLIHDDSLFVMDALGFCRDRKLSALMLRGGELWGLADGDVWTKIDGAPKSKMKSVQ